MAVMYPQEMDEYLSEGERKVFYEFKEKLSDKWTVFYSLRWIKNEKTYINQSEGEADFILINPEYGVMILEVKGGHVSCINGQWTSISQNNIKSYIKDPEKQADISKYELLSKFRSQNINAYVTTGVCFPDSDLKNMNLPLNMPENIVIDMNSFDDIEKKLISIFKFRAANEKFDIYKMNESEFNKIKQILIPKVDSKISLKNRIKTLNFKYIELNDEQSKCFEYIEDNRFISIKGHAGTGKTVLAMKKALRDSMKGKRVLYICYNTLLYEKMKKDSEDAFDVFCIYGFAEEYLRMNHKEYYDEFQKEADYDKMINHYMELCSDNKEKGNILYDTILVDEGQDFEEAWFKSLYNFLEDKNGSLYVFYDELQMLYEKFGRTDISFLDIGTKYTLKRNMRNTDEISLSSLRVMGMNKDEIDLRGIKGIEPQIFIAESKLDIQEKLKFCFKELKKQNVEDKDITVLVNNVREKIKYRNEIRNYSSCLIETIRKFKGLESNIVVIPDLNHDFMDNDETRKLLYVAMSRAMVHVIIIINTENMNRKQRAFYKKEIYQKFFE